MSRVATWVTVRIIWYDEHAGSTWKLVYDAGEPEMKTARMFTARGLHQWRTETVHLTDAVLDHGGDRGSDFALINTDDIDDVFSLVELHRD